MEEEVNIQFNLQIFKRKRSANSYKYRMSGFSYTRKGPLQLNKLFEINYFLRKNLNQITSWS